MTYSIVNTQLVYANGKKLHKDWNLFWRGGVLPEERWVPCNDGFDLQDFVTSENTFCHSERSEESYTIERSPLCLSCVHIARIRFFTTFRMTNSVWILYQIITHRNLNQRRGILHLIFRQHILSVKINGGNIYK